MKKTLLPFLSLFILLTAFTCEDEPLDDEIINNSITDNSVQSVFSAEIDGETFNTNNVVAVKYILSSNPMVNNRLDISATKIAGMNFETVSLVILEPAIGSFELGGNNNLNFGSYGNNYDVYLSESDDFDNEVMGTVTITEIDEVDNKVSGNFQFTAINFDGDEVQLTNGSFSNISYTIEEF